MVSSKKLLEELDEIDLALVRDLISRELISLETEFGHGTTRDDTENMRRLRALYAFFMRGTTQTIKKVKLPTHRPR